MASEGGNIEVCSWLKTIPVAPEYHPTLAEFQDPIGYIFKIEKEASRYGICKIVPPVSAASKKSIITNFNKSLLARSNDPKLGPTFTTRQQQVGFCPRKHRPVRKPVWQSGERYTLSEFEAKAKVFERGYLRKYVKKVLSSLDIETLYWNATVDKPFSVEYANDMPGSAFVEKKSGGKRVNESVGTVADTEWNMRGVSRSNISLLRFMKEEIPGVTSPMVYVAMMFSWFAWHVEDHDLHSLNYLHMGAGKTWYGVPKEAAVAFEEVIREHGYSGEINPLVTFATLGEKTTVMSPEVLINAGVPCCRLVQNAGEFVVTFPRAYHSGFSHGFNCGEASNIATPEWLRFAKEAAIRRASINCPPMVSHFQLLYDLALSLCSRVPKNITEPRSSRLKDKRKCEGELLIKELFVQDIMQNNDMLHILGKGASIVLLPRNTLTNSNLHAGQELTAEYRLFPRLCGPDFARDEFMPERMKSARDYTESGKVFLYHGNNTEQMGAEMKKATQSKRGLLSCVTCGILCFSCVAIIQPTETASRYLMSADCDILNDDLGVSSDEHKYNVGTYNPNTNRISVPKQDGLFNIPISCTNKVQNIACKESVDVVSKNSNVTKGPSSLGLLALAYGVSSDSDDDGETELADIPVNGRSEGNYSESGNPGINCGTHVSRHISNSNATSGRATWSVADSGNIGYSDEFQSNTVEESNSLAMSFPSRSNQDSSRLHVFCLEHAVQVEKSLSSVGGANIVLICHPEYPKFESEARKVAEELEKDSEWCKISFREATNRDEDVIQLALESENTPHGNGDWAVKLGINLSYSASLSRSPLYCKQMPYNSVIYNAFGRNPPPENQFESEGKVFGRQKKIVVAGKWCGKVWMSTQAHPLLINKDSDENDLEFSKVPRSKPRLSNQDLTNNKPNRKRKITEVNRSSKIGKSPEAEESSESYRGFAKSRKPIKRKRGGKPPLKKKVAHSDDDMNESSDEFHHKPQKQVKCRFGNERLHKETSEAENSGSSSDEFPSWKQNISKTKARPTEDEYSEESEEEEPPLNNNWKQNLGKNKALPLSEDESEEEHSLNNLWKQNISKNTARRMEDESSEESEEESPLSKNWKQISCKSKKRQPEREISPEVEEESSEEFQPSNSRKRPNAKRGTPAKQVKKKIPPAETLSESSGEETIGNYWALAESPIEDELEEGGPSSRLRQRPKKPSKISGPKLSAKSKPPPKAQKEVATKKGKYKEEEGGEHPCDMEGCGMSFSSKQELLLHKRNICPVRGCGKKFFSHKYLVQHRRVHIDDRPLKCPWKGCKMTFKWAWARTEHIRVHTGARPYICTQAGCGQTFRFVSDFSRHKRKTGHNPKKTKV